MKKFLSSLLGLALCLSLATPAALADGPWNGRTAAPSQMWTSLTLGMNNFRRVRDYAPGTFSDVPAGAWYEQGVQTLYERGLTEGGRSFAPQGGITLGEVVSLAVLIHRTYNGWSMPEGMSGLQYALNMGIVTAGQYDDYTLPATRRSFAAIMANALPSEALRGINIVMDGAIPDVPMADPGAPGIYLLYRAGVLEGGDARGTFHPDRPILRGTAAVIAGRMVDPALRQGNTLLKEESFSVSLNRTAMVLVRGQSEKLSASIFPVNTENRTVTWASSEPRTATVGQDGTVTALQTGTVLIMATAESGAMATCTVRVVDWT